MSAQSIPIVSVSVTVPSASETRLEERRRERRTGEVDQASEYSETHIKDGGKKTHAGYAEGLPFAKKKADTFLVQKEMRSLLEKSLKDSGVQPQDFQNKTIEQLAEQELSFLNTQIQKTQQEMEKQQGSPNPAIQNLKSRYEKISASLEDYRTSQFSGQSSLVQEPSGPIEQKTPAASVSVNTSLQTASQELSLLKDLSALVGHEIESDADTGPALAKLNAKSAHELKQSRTKEVSLKNELDQLQKKLKKVQNPSSTEGVQIKAQMEKVKKDLEVISSKQKTIQMNLSQAERISDQIVAIRTRRDLNLDSHPESTSAEEVMTPSRSLPVGVRSASISGRRSSQAGGQTGNSRRVSTASVDESTSEVSTQSANQPVLQTADYTNTNFSIMSTSTSTSAQTNADIQKTNRMIAQLIASIRSGNADAIPTAMILLSKKSSYSSINMSLKVITAMQYYEQQTASLVTKLGTLQGNNPTYSSQLASTNAQINTYSQNRQAIMSFMQTTLSDEEQIKVQTKSIIDKMQRTMERLLQ